MSLSLSKPWLCVALARAEVMTCIYNRLNLTYIEFTYSKHAFKDQARPHFHMKPTFKSWEVLKTKRFQRFMRRCTTFATTLAARFVDTANCINASSTRMPRTSSATRFTFFGLYLTKTTTLSVIPLLEMQLKSNKIAFRMEATWESYEGSHKCLVQNWGQYGADNQKIHVSIRKAQNARVHAWATRD